jgi:cathepsin L
MEGQRFIKKGVLTSLSEQQIVDCSRDYGNFGCDGGLMTNSYKYIKAAGGIEGAEDYPYTATVSLVIVK